MSEITASLFIALDGVLHLVYGPDTAPPEGSYETAREHLPQDS